MKAVATRVVPVIRRWECASTYASTTECSQLLLKELNVPCEGRFVSRKAGAFSVEGSAGDDKGAHITQFRQMDTALFAKLRARWTR